MYEEKNKPEKLEKTSEPKCENGAIKIKEKRAGINKEIVELQEKIKKQKIHI